MTLIISVPAARLESAYSRGIADQRKHGDLDKNPFKAGTMSWHGWRSGFNNASTTPAVEHNPEMVVAEPGGGNVEPIVKPTAHRGFGVIQGGLA